MVGWDAANVAAAMRFRKWFRRGFCIVSMALVLSILADHLRGAAGDDWGTYDGRTFVVRSVPANDGLTVETSPGISQPVHLIGLATVDGQEVSTEALKLVGTAVTLKLDPTQTRDADGRLLAYAFANDREMINVDWVHQGLALADRRMPYLLHGQVDEAETDARKKRRGLWAIMTDETMPEWRKQWLDSMHARKSRIPAP
jgi:endonuclease YncB( thermonuclease family)